jgi:hypothetical protein
LAATGVSAPAERGVGSPWSARLGRVVGVQTFVPYAGLDASAAVLDDRRLGKQRVETLQVLRALALPDYGWQRHPAVLMWAGALPGLVAYGRGVVREWSARGYADTTLEPITEFAPEVVGVEADELLARGWLPEWWGDESVHRSHRSALVRKDPGHYAPLFPDADPQQPYVWPDGRPIRGDAVASGLGVRDLWVVRPVDDLQAQATLRLGVVGLDASSGVDVDVSGAGERDLVALLRERAPRRRPGKALRQLQALVTSVQPGDVVGLLVDGGAALVVGEVVGDYAFGAPEEALSGVLHSRRVHWHGTVPRAAVRPPALLQDPRNLFRVTADASAVGRALAKSDPAAG